MFRLAQAIMLLNGNVQSAEFRVSLVGGQAAAKSPVLLLI
jgi:hypothetical protein